MTYDRHGPVPPPPPVPASAPGPWQPAYPAPVPRRRPPGWLVWLAAGTAVASVAAFLAGLLWPVGPDAEPPAGPLVFHRFASVERLEFGQPSHTTLTAVQGDQGYTAWEQAGDLHVIAFDVATGDERWRRVVTGAPRWSRLLAAPGALLVFAHELDVAAPRRMFVVDPETGEVRWHRDVRGDDQLFFLEGALGWLDRGGRALHGLDLASGGERWREELPGGLDVTGVAVLGAADLARPSDLAGTPSPGTGDHRIVLVNPDRSVSVIDGNTGETLSRALNIAAPADRVLAYDGRLFVAADEFGYQLVSYDLAQLSGVPRVHYAAPDTERYPTALEPCGAGRLCLLEGRSFDTAATELVAVDAVDGGEVWRAPVPQAERLLGVGEWAVVTASLGFNPTVAAFDAGGRTALQSPGLPVRLNAENLLIFTSARSAEPGLRAAAVATDEGEPFGLGQLPESVVDEQCSWSDRYLVCPDLSGAEIWRFAEPA